MIMSELTDVDLINQTLLKEFFRSLEFNWTMREMTVKFPLFSDAESNLQRSETLTRAFICRKKLLQVAKKTKEEELVELCEHAKNACKASTTPFEEFVTISQAFFHATVMRIFQISLSVRNIQKKRERRKGHKRAGRRITKARRKKSEKEVKEAASVRRSSRMSSQLSEGSQDENGSQTPSPFPDDTPAKATDNPETADKPRENCCEAF